ncbi:MAG: hypothetical protein IJ829_01250, partial [Kiritimatiellae bacterium]|nr:hypothetical protein [Kiritimatiellia bacterium]
MSRARLRAVAALVVLLFSAPLFATDYTWTGGGDDNGWRTPENWGETTKYPGNGDRMIFPEGCTAEVELGAVNNYEAVSYVRVLAGASVRFYAADPDAQTRLDMKGSWELNYAGNSVEFDHIKAEGNKNMTLGGGATLVLKNGSELYVNAFAVDAAKQVSLLGGSTIVSSGAHTANSSVGTLLVVDGSTWNSGDFTLKNTATNLLLNGATMNVNSLTVNGAGTFVSIDDSTFVVRGNFNLGDAAPGGGRFLFKGAHPLLKQTGGGYFKANRSNADMTAHFDFDFLVPEGGFAEVPVWRSTGQEAYRDNTSIPAGYFRFNVLASSPAVTAGTRTDCPLFFSSQSGITRERMANGDDETATLRFADYPGETEAISTATAKAVYATIGSGGGAVRAAAHGAIENYSATARTQHTITATGRATALANGGATTRMELWGGTENDAATMALADTAYPAALGEFSATYTEPVHTQDQTYYLQFRVVDTDISGATNYTCAGEIFNATIVDSAAYTWTGAGSDDKWSNPDNWADDQGGDCVGAPISSGSTARILKTATVDLDVTATIAKLDLAATGADVVLTSSSTVDYRLTLNGLDLPRDNSVWTIDGAYVTRAADVTTTPGSRVVIKNGGYFYLNSLHPKAANSVWEVGEGGTNSVANLYIAAGGACVISNGYMNCRGNLYLTDNSAGGELVLKGTHPSLSMSNNSGYFRSSFATPAATLGFEVPEGGYDAPPITGASGNTRTFFDTASSAGVSISVLGSSGAYRGAAATKTTLVRWVKGYSSYLTFAPLATADAGGGFAVENTTDLTVTVYPGDRSDRLTVISAHGTPSPAVGVHTGYADGAESTLSAGSVVEVSASERYVPVGWKRYSVDPFTVERTLVDSGDGDALEYVHPGEWTAVEWLWRRDCAATATTDGHGTAAVSAEWTDEDSFATATATPSDGFRFSYWSGDVVDVPILENPAKFPGDRPRALVANFVAADAEVATNRYTGAKDGSWNTDGNWSLGHVPTAEEAVEIPSGKGTVKITNEGRCASLRIVSDSSLQLLGSGAVAGGQIRLDVRGDAVSFGPNLTLGNGTVHDYDVLFNVGGDLCISNNNKAAKMLVYAGDAYGTNANAVIAAGFAGETAAPRIRDYWRGGAQVNVGGKLFLGGSHSSNVSTLEIYSHYKTGLSPVFRVGSLEIGEKGAVNGSSYGWRSYNGVGWFGLGSSRRAGSNGYWGGASYGGEGGRPTVADAGSGGATYGFENAPCWPGSAGGANGSDGGYGGSLFRVHAQGAAKIDGAVSVNGSAWNQTGRGGGAGGGVWITCDTFEAGASAKISAKGGGNSAANGSAGGGGRVVVATGCTSDGDIRAFLETGACAGYTAADFSATLWPSLIDVSGGVNYAALAVHNDWNDGSAGTAKFLQNANGKAILTVAGSPVAVGAADPAYVTHVVDEGDAACVNDEYGYVPGTSNGTRYALDGYVWTNSVANGSGSGTTAVGPALGETTLVWLWRDKAHNLDATSGGYGSVSAHDEWIADGERVTLTATPGEGAVFVRWIGDIDAADAANAGITFTMTAPRRLVAVFDKPAAAPRALTYSGGDWFDPATWDGTAIPGTNDAVTASSALSFPFGGTIDVGSLDIPGGALSVAPVQGAYNAEAASDFDTPLALHVHGDFSVGGSAVLSIGSLDGDIRTDIIVDGDMTVSGTATIQAYASVGEADGSLRTWRHYKAGGASVSVGGDLMIDGSARVFNHCHGQSGVGVVWHAGGDVTIGENAQFNGSIWSAENNSYGYGWRFPNGINIVAEGAGSHGGAGGGRDASTTYGYACAPFLPGSPGNGNKSEEKGEGGGTVRIDAGGTVALNGKIYVTGGSNNGGGNNAGAGGSVWITCGAFEPGAAALVNARGGRSNQHSACRGGGGGRVSIITGSPTEEQLDSLYATGAAE